MSSRLMVASLAWMEIRTTLAKLTFKHDLTLLDQDLNWFNDSRMHTLWEKPHLEVKVTPRI